MNAVRSSRLFKFSKDYGPTTFARELSLIGLGVLFMIPLYLLVSVSLKPLDETFTRLFAPPTHLDFGNYSQAWSQGVGISLGHALLNSLLITVVSVVVIVSIGSVTGYVIARRATRLTTVLYAFFVITIIFPVQLGVIPLFVAARHLGLVGTYAGMILIYSGVLLPLSIFLYTGFIRALPIQYDEAAQVDGARRVRLFVRVIFPLLRPVTGTVVVLTGLVVWNDFFTPLIFLGGTAKETLPVAVYSFVGEYLSDWNKVFAGVVISVVPMLILFLFTQKQLIRGFTTGIRG